MPQRTSTLEKILSHFPALNNDDNNAKNSWIMCYGNGQVNSKVALWACRHSDCNNTKNWWKRQKKHATIPFAGPQLPNPG